MLPPQSRPALINHLWFLHASVSNPRVIKWRHHTIITPCLSAIVIHCVVTIDSLHSSIDIHRMPHRLHMRDKDRELNKMCVMNTRWTMKEGWFIFSSREYQALLYQRIVHNPSLSHHQVLLWSLIMHDDAPICDQSIHMWWMMHEPWWKRMIRGVPQCVQGRVYQSVLIMVSSSRARAYQLTVWPRHDHAQPHLLICKCTCRYMTHWWMTRHCGQQVDTFLRLSNCSTTIRIGWSITTTRQYHNTWCI